eukprot:gene16336-22256_t
MSKRVLMVLTSTGIIPGTDIPVGWYLPELAHPFFRFKSQGYSIEIASIAGGDTVVTPASLNMEDEENKLFWETEEFKNLTLNTKKLSDCNSDDYDILFFVGGFGTMWDFPFDSSVNRLGQEIYEKGGVLGAVCHGPIAYSNIKLSNGEYLIKGKDVAGFTNQEEEMAGLLAHLPVHEGLGRSCEDVLSAIGGNYSKTSPWGAHVAGGDRVFSGQNPASAGPTADAIIAAVAAL